MSEYTTGGGPAVGPHSQDVNPAPVDADERLRRAEIFLALPSLFSYDQPLDEVLATIARTIVEQTNAVSAAVTLVRPDDVSTIALGYHNLPAGYPAGMVRTRQSAFHTDWLRTRAREDRSWVVRDAKQFMSTSDDYAHMRDEIPGLPFDTLIGTPFLNRPDALGFVYLYYEEDAQVDDGEIEFARDLARHARPLMDNAWLFSETKRRANEIEALYRADEALHRSLRLEDVVKSMSDLALDMLGAESSLVVTWQDDDRLGVVSAVGIPEDVLKLIAERYRTFGRDHFASIGPPFPTAMIEDIRDTRIPVELQAVGPGSFAEIAVMVGGELWGLFSIGWNRPRTFTDDDLRLFNAFASRAGLAIQNALLYEQAQKSASMEERQRIARELHDSVSQALYGIGLGARTARRRLGDSAPASVTEPVDYIVQLAESGLAETRALIFELVPESLEEQGLVLALQRQAAATQSRYRVEVAAYLGEEPRLPLRAKEALYRIAQESLHNMAKHAQANHASISLIAEGENISLVIEDDGKGFDPGEEFPGHFGLRNMEERARRIGGAYSIRSAPGRGTAVTVTLPAGG